MHRGRDDEQRGEVDEQETAVEDREVVEARGGEPVAVDPEVMQHPERTEQHEQAERTGHVEGDTCAPTG